MALLSGTIVPLVLRTSIGMVFLVQLVGQDVLHCAALPLLFVELVVSRAVTLSCPFIQFCVAVLRPAHCLPLCPNGGPAWGLSLPLALCVICFLDHFPACYLARYPGHCLVPCLAPCPAMCPVCCPVYCPASYLDC